MAGAGGGGKHHAKIAKVSKNPKRSFGTLAPLRWTLKLVPRKRFNVPFKALLNAAADRFAKVENTLIRDGVVNIQPLFSTLEDACFNKNLQMTRGIGLRQPRLLYQFADAHLARLQGVDEPKSAGFTQRLKTPGDKFEGMIRQCFGGGRLWHKNKFDLR